MGGRGAPGGRGGRPPAAGDPSRARPAAMRGGGTSDGGRRWLGLGTITPTGHKVGRAAAELARGGICSVGGRRRFCVRREAFVRVAFLLIRCMLELRTMRKGCLLKRVKALKWGKAPNPFGGAPCRRGPPGRPPPPPPPPPPPAPPPRRGGRTPNPASRPGPMLLSSSHLVREGVGILVVKQSGSVWKEDEQRETREGSNCH